MALKEIFNANAAKYTEGRYQDFCEIVLRYKEHRDMLIRKTVMLMIPDLAKLDVSEFMASFFNSCMIYLLGQLKKDKERPTAFTAIGKVSLIVKSGISPHLDGILAAIKESLIAKGKNKAHNEIPSYQCISMLAISVGPALTKHMHDLLDYMFVVGLSDPFREALVDLSANIPPLLSSIQERLLDMISLILFSRPFLHPGAPSKNDPSHLYSSLALKEVMFGLNLFKHDD